MLLLFKLTEKKYVKFRASLGSKWGENRYGRVALKTSKGNPVLTKGNLEACGLLSTAIKFNIDEQ